jgi:hypothetical protein
LFFKASNPSPVLQAPVVVLSKEDLPKAEFRVAVVFADKAFFLV